MGLKGVCCQQRARAKASKRQLASKATSPGLLLMRLPQTMTTRKMCSRIMSCLMTVTWRTDSVMLSHSEAMLNAYRCADNRHDEASHSLCRDQDSPYTLITVCIVDLPERPVLMR